MDVVMCLVGKGDALRAVEVFCASLPEGALATALPLASRPLGKRLGRALAVAVLELLLVQVCAPRLLLVVRELALAFAALGCRAEGVQLCLARTLLRVPAALDGPPVVFCKRKRW